MNRIAAFHGILVVTLCAGCGAHKRVDGTDQVLPQPFEIELRAYATGKRAVYYILKEDGRLYYGGGRDANARMAPHDVGITSDDQRMQLWSIIRQHNLLNARGQFNPKQERIEYELRLRCGSHRRSFTAKDDTVPGLDILDEALFRIQAARRFAD